MFGFRRGAEHQSSAPLDRNDLLKINDVVRGCFHTPMHEVKDPEEKSVCRAPLDNINLIGFLQVGDSRLT